MAWIERILFFRIYSHYLYWKNNFRSRYFRNRYAYCSKIDNSVILGKYSEITIDSSSSFLEIMEDVCFRKYCQVLLCKNGRLKIGKGVFFNNYCSINCLTHIEIGENTIIGENVKIYDHNHKYSFTDKLEIERDNFSLGKVIIGKNCWIGSNVTILKGVEIGDNVIIGANCLLYKSIPPNTIVKHSESLIITK